MSDSGSSEIPVERCSMQRDWLGHALQLLGIFVVLGLPIAYWGSSVNMTITTLEGEVKHNTQDILEQRQIQTILTSQIIDAGKQLTRIETLIGSAVTQGKNRR